MEEQVKLGEQARAAKAQNTRKRSDSGGWNSDPQRQHGAAASHGQAGWNQPEAPLDLPTRYAILSTLT